MAQSFTWVLSQDGVGQRAGRRGVRLDTPGLQISHDQKDPGQPTSPRNLCPSTGATSGNNLCLELLGPVLWDENIVQLVVHLLTPSLQPPWAS